jgi:hypothetical protein
MSSVRKCFSTQMWVGAFFLLVTVCPMPSNAADTATQDRLEALVHQYLGLYVVPPSRRDASESVSFAQGRLTVVYRWPKKNKSRGLLCTGGRWLAVGRLTSARGARALFKALPRLNFIELRLVDIRTQVKPIGDGKYRQERQIIELARFELSKERARKLDPKVLRATLSGQRCERFVKNLLDEVRLREE